MVISRDHHLRVPRVVYRLTKCNKVASGGNSTKDAVTESAGKPEIHVLQLPLVLVDHFGAVAVRRT